MVVVWMNSTFVGILHRTDEQQAAAAAAVGALSGESDADRGGPRYLVAELKCLHRGCYVGYVDTPEAAFKCPCHRTTFDTSGRVIKGKTDKSLPCTAQRQRRRGFLPLIPNGRCRRCLHLLKGLRLITALALFACGGCVFPQHGAVMQWSEWCRTGDAFALQFKVRMI